MRGRKIMYASVCILLIGSIFLFQYFYISGKEIRFASEIGGDCTVTVSKYRITEWREREEQLLDGQQIQELKELILSSSFTRTLSETVRHDDDFYDISVFFDFQQEPLVDVYKRQFRILADRSSPDTAPKKVPAVQPGMAIAISP